MSRIIETDADVSAGAAWLAGQDPHLARALVATGPLPLRRRPDGFSELLSAIVSQQVSVASARAIQTRLLEAGMTSEAAVRAVSEVDLRALGLSRQKARYAHALASAAIDYPALRTASDAEVVRTLTAVPGIGVWTAEIYAMFSLGRPDVFAAGDLALQEAARVLYDLPERPRERALRERAAAWSPWRSVAARLLFAYYRVARQRDGIT
ncbi:DNA-3-methyladenine glycosylase 2 family protein [uncultured Roseobacter sp.]|uniref:DNA-3-methyladenine glycosylase family protein n=1 Tax=uncultured Roseobacter sp. TaxID=114847 RepID=UPI0026122D3F|nr:DNA-3-methyladenine glycosylase 2 family protein [uncultured Roseobacter sp.]